MTLSHCPLALVALLPAIGCNCGPQKCPDGTTVMPCPGLHAMGDDAGALSQCLPGAWFNDGDGGSCQPIFCDQPDAGPPECASSDCVVREFALFVPSTAGAVAGTDFF